MTEFLRGIIKPYMIVFSHVLREPHTIKYPYERLRFFKGYRGRISLGAHKCIGCGLCSKTCPNEAIEMVTVEGQEHKFPQIDFGKCSFCGLCVEICPRGALQADETVELSTTKREDLVHSPTRLSEPQSLEKTLKENRKMLSVQIQGNKISYVVESEVKE